MVETPRQLVLLGVREVAVEHREVLLLLGEMDLQQRVQAV
jgi:hypothetical protein